MVDNGVHTYPQVLLMGNGLNQAFGGTSWNDLIKKINVRSDIDPCTLHSKNIPFPMQAILVTDNNLKKAMQEQRDSFWGQLETEDQKKELQEILSMGFSDILTTNYSYELEAAAADVMHISQYRLEIMSEAV